MHKIARFQTVSDSGRLDMVDDCARLFLISCPCKLIVDYLIAMLREGIDCNSVSLPWATLRVEQAAPFMSRSLVSVAKCLN